mmetsp:Transcript_10980/g.25876  ORF Transcript_10980/g.25876 Transcript_10980/m.25876 type:complete len:497 (-) Transcript_10980:173-1663(-)
MAAGVGSGGTMALPAHDDDQTHLHSHIAPLSFVTHERAHTCGSAAQVRMQRAIVATASGIALLVLVALVNLGSNDTSRNAIELEMLKALEQSGKTTAAHAGGKTFDVAALVAEGQDTVKEELKSLQHKASKEDAKASKLDKEVVDAEKRLKKFVLDAKRDQDTGKESEVEAKEDVSHASLLRRKAQKLRDESEKARRAFVAQEKPVEMATKLAAHDHHNYRKDELLVAQEVALLSEHPTDPKLRAKVDKLVKQSKVAKGRMEEDSELLRKLEKQTASARLGGTKGYTHLKAQSVAIAKKAEQLADEAVELAKSGHSMKAKAREIVKKVEEKEAKPDALHAQADSIRADYKTKMAQVAQLEQALTKIHDQQLKQEGKEALASKNKYSGMRSELERDVGENKEGTSQKKQDELKVAKDSYDELEELEMKKEKAKLAAEREKTKGGGSSGSELGDSSSGAAMKEAELKRAHIISAKQSTFLSGLFSNKAPWDTKRNVED